MINKAILIGNLGGGRHSAAHYLPRSQSKLKADLQ